MSDTPRDARPHAADAVTRGAAPSAVRPVWAPTADEIAGARLTAFMRHVATADPTAVDVADYASLYAWSVARPDRFWPAAWAFCGVVAESRGDAPPWDEVLVGGDRMAPPDAALGPRWFTGARLNFAENLLRFRDDRVAVIAWSERGPGRRLTYADLADEAARVADALRAAGVAAGDRVAGFLPNIPEAVVAMLAATSLGAVWSSCSPDFGVNGVLDRFGQIAPKVLFAADGYVYAGKAIDVVGRVRDIAAAIPSLERVVLIPYLHDVVDAARVPNGVAWADFGVGGGRGPDGETGDVGAPPRDQYRAPFAESPNHFVAARTIPTRTRRTLGPDFLRLPFDHPLYIMYSSGTTGLPKCMVHGAGGTLVQHLKELVLHTDLTRDDRIFYFTTCGWMMWNWLVSSLAVGAAVVLYDGAPLAPRPDILWEMAARERVTVFGTSAKYLALCEKDGVRPREAHDLSALRAVLSTGSPLAEHSYDYVAAHVKPNVRLSSISGGTDIISCFALGNPIAPVYRGELQARGLGMAVDVFDERGRPVRGAAGELVCTRPFPSMPVAFWNDGDGAKYRGAYFDHFPGVWRHGDWAELTERDGLLIYGRSDATLNPGGVRVGTAEIYRQVEQIDDVVESVVIEQQVGDGAAAGSRIVLFVRLRAGVALDEALRERIRQRVRAELTPHHVPKVVAQVADIPRTISGKITELAVRDVVHGRAVKNVDALANPQALELFRDHPALRG